MFRRTPPTALVVLSMLGLLAFSQPAAAHSDATPAPDPCPAYLQATPSPEATAGMGGHMHGGETAEFDLMFIDMMIPHHEGAVAMANAALHHAERQEIIDLSHSIIDSQSEEIEQMLAWRDEWYPGAEQMPMADMETAMTDAMGHDMGMHGGHMMGMDMAGDMVTLCSAADFDRAFLELMIPHHESAVMMAEALKKNAVHDEMKNFADQIITAQTAEIEQMKGWLLEWYGATPVA